MHKINKYTLTLLIGLIFISIISFYFVTHNENFYNKSIAKITSITEKYSKVTSITGKSEDITEQQITAIVMNGDLKNKIINLENKTSYSEVNDLAYKVNDEVFFSFQRNSKNEITSYRLLDLKRDKYLVASVTLFSILILIIGGMRGFKSLCCLTFNILIFFITIKLFLQGFSLILVAGLASILFIVISIALVCGLNKKALSAVIGTLAGTSLAMFIAISVINLTHSNGLHFEEMEFLTHAPEQIFIIEILIGTLGAIMDIAISIASSLKEIFDANPNISNKELIKSGKEIGKDIMGTMANTLVFAYVSGSIPIILLLLRNQFPISYIISINLSLEIIRALTGSIGIVLSIPITIYVSVLFIKNRKFGGLN